jgi:thiol-disulfide isomerase/thioredoxin
MRHVLWVGFTVMLLGFFAVPVRADSVPDVLKFSDLVDHPERWPDQVTMQNTLQFTDGSSLTAGQKMKLANVDSSGVQVTATGATNFGVGPDDTDVLAAANAIWSKLNADQRHLSLASIQGDASLWPLTLKLTGKVSFANGTVMQPGTEVNFLHFHQDTPDAVEFSVGELVANWAPYDLTDLFARARELAAVGRDSRTSRIVAQLKGNTVDSDGKPVDCPDKGVKYYALYFSASWCPPCRQFAPKMVAFANQFAAAHPELAIVMVSEEDLQASTGQHVSQNYDADMLKYMKDMGMNWIAVPPSVKKKCPNLYGYGNLCWGDYAVPALVVTDRFGTVIAAAQDNEGTIAKLKKLLNIS